MLRSKAGNALFLAGAFGPFWLFGAFCVLAPLRPPESLIFELPLATSLLILAAGCGRVLPTRRAKWFVIVGLLLAVEFAGHAAYGPGLALVWHPLTSVALCLSGVLFADLSPSLRVLWAGVGVAWVLTNMVIFVLFVVFTNRMEGIH